jgi:hypothetical protein
VKTGCFWAALNDLSKLEGENRAEATKLLSDIDELSRQEEAVLREALGGSSAMRLIGDVAPAMDLLRSSSEWTRRRECPQQSSRSARRGT